jgi:hypothetical protein
MVFVVHKSSASGDGAAQIGQYGRRPEDDAQIKHDLVPGIFSGPPLRSGPAILAMLVISAVLWAGIISGGYFFWHAVKHFF